MIFEDKHPKFTSAILSLKACLALCLKRFLIVDAVVGAFTKEKSLVGAFSRHFDIHECSLTALLLMLG